MGTTVSQKAVRTACAGGIRRAKAVASFFPLATVLLIACKAHAIPYRFTTIALTGSLFADFQLAAVASALGGRLGGAV